MDIIEHSTPALAEKAGKYVKIEGRGSTGRTTPQNFFEQTAMDAAKQHPFEPGEGNTVRKVVEGLGDTHWSGWGMEENLC